MYFCTLYRYFIIVYFITVSTSVEFQWLDSDNRFDCVVGITVNDKPVGIGTLLHNNFLITSANPLEQFLEKSKKQDKRNNKTKYDEYFDSNKIIKFHAIDKAVNKSKILHVTAIYGNVAKRKDVWIRMGFNKTHSPIHDLLAISIKEDQIKKSPASSDREAFYLDPTFNSYFTSGLTFAGFGYVNWFHIVDNTVLEMASYDDSDFVNCDEWIPRPWGRFICLLNVEHFRGLQSGSPLFYQGALRGVGSFLLEKGNESILVFTDYSLYSFDSIHNFTLKANSTSDW